MEVTRKNYRESISEITETIQKSQFFIIDSEFTGISTEFNITPFDTPEDFYLKTIKTSSGFILIQLGLTCWFVENEKYKYKSYNFYVYPRSKKHIFQCQGDAMQFLATNGFDFNKLFLEGISCCGTEEAENLRKTISEKQQFRADILNGDGAEIDVSNHIPIPLEEKDRVDEICKNIEKFLKSDDNELIVEKCNGFQRKLIYQLIEAKFLNKVTATSKNLGLSIERKKSASEEKELELEKIKKDEEYYFDVVGLSYVMKLLSDTKKIIVGHNMLLDLLYVLKQFFGPLPDDFNEFKKFAHGIFPNLIDTKFITSSEQFKDKINSTVLAHVYQSVSQPPFVIPDFEIDSLEHSYSMDSPKEHEAGFDSYLTGICFITLANHLKIKPSELTENNKILKKYINKIFLVRLQDVNYINLADKEPKPQRSHVFHISFPSNWKQSDIVYHFRNYGSIFVGWINETSAYVALHNRENSLVVLKTIGKTPGVTIMSYDDFKSPKTATTEITPKLRKEQKKRKISDSKESDDKAEAKCKKLVTPRFTENDSWE